jgi:hypothetical protein
MPTLIDSYASSNGPTYLYSGSYTKAGQSFTVDTYNYVLDSVAFILHRSGSPSGNCYAVIYGHSGTYGTSSVPTGSVLATSDAVSASSLYSISTTTTFTFSGANKITLSADTHYIACIVYEGGNSSNFIVIKMKASGSHDGNECVYSSSSTWLYTSGTDTAFYVYGDVSVDSFSVTTQNLNAALLSPTVLHGQTLIPTTPNITIAVINPIVGTGVSITQTVVNATLAILSPTVSITGSTYPYNAADIYDLTTDQYDGGDVTPTGDVVIRPGTMNLYSAVLSPQANYGVVSSLSTLNAIITPISPVVGIGMNVSLTVVNATIALYSPSFIATAISILTTQNLTINVLSSGLVIGQTAYTTVVNMTFSVPSPVVINRVGEWTLVAKAPIQEWTDITKTASTWNNINKS